MNLAAKLLDRTAILFLGVAAGAAIGFAFGQGGDEPKAVVQPAPPSLTGKAATASAQPAAAEPIECAAPFQPRLLRSLASGERVRVGVFGDSFGDGVWSALYRQLPAKEQFEVAKFSQQSTGFTRYASLNVEEHDAGQVAQKPVDIAVISFGANDTQGVMHKGKYAALMSPEWQAEIGGRVESYVWMLRDQGAVVYWVGLPRMRKPSFDADIMAMNDFYARRMKALDVPFIDTRAAAADAAGQYSAYLPNPETGKNVLIRANDGIHMSMTGYTWITADLSRRIKSYVGKAREMAVAVNAAAPATRGTAAAPTAGAGG